MEFSAEHFEKFIRALERLEGIDEKVDIVVKDIATKQQDHEDRIRSLEVFRNWGTGVAAGIAFIWGAVKTGGTAVLNLFSSGQGV